MAVRVAVIAQIREGMDRAEALTYWREVHGAFGAKVPGVRRYVQNHAVRGVNGDPEFLGYGELWFDSVEDFEEAMASPEFATALADAENFADMSRAWFAFVEEHVILDGPVV